MKKLIYILLFSILSIASYGQTCVATGTTKAGKLGMCSPSLGTASDSVVVWNGTGEKLLKYIPRSSFNELTADELAAIQNANAPNAGNPFATMGDVAAHQTLQQICDNGATFYNGSQTIDLSGGVFISEPDGSGFYANQYEADMVGGSGEGVFIDPNKIVIKKNGSSSVNITYDPALSTNYTVQYPAGKTGTQVPAFISDLTGFGTGTVTSVTGTNGITVASGTSTPVIGQKLTAFANLEFYPTQIAILPPVLTIVNNPTSAVLTTAYVDFGQYNIISDLPIFADSYPNDDTWAIEQHAILSQLTGTIRGWYCYRIDDYTIRLECVSDFLTVGSYDNDIFDGKILVTIKLKL